MVMDARCLRSGRLKSTEYGTGFWFPSRRSLQILSTSSPLRIHAAYIRTCTDSSVRSSDVAKLKASIVSGAEAVRYQLPWACVIRNHCMMGKKKVQLSPRGVHHVKPPLSAECRDTRVSERVHVLWRLVTAARSLFASGETVEIALRYGAAASTHASVIFTTPPHQHKPPSLPLRRIATRWRV